MKNSGSFFFFLKKMTAITTIFFFFMIWHIQHEKIILNFTRIFIKAFHLLILDKTLKIETYNSKIY